MDVERSIVNRLREGRSSSTKRPLREGVQRRDLVNAPIGQVFESIDKQGNVIDRFVCIGPGRYSWMDSDGNLLDNNKTTLRGYSIFGYEEVLNNLSRGTYTFRVGDKRYTPREVSKMKNARAIGRGPHGE